MSDVIQAFLNHDIKTFVELIGQIGVWFVVFAESGLLIGFFLPGDSLLFTAGLLSSNSFGLLSVWPLLLGSWVAAVLGDNIGYEFGRRAGRKLFKKEQSILFKPGNLIKAQEFYEKHGGKAIVLARFMPVIRTFAPIVAGIGNMDHKRFTFFNFIGGTIWVWGLTWAGYFLGNLITDVDKYLLPIIVGIVLLSVLPPILHIYKQNRKSWNEKLLFRLKKLF